MNLFQTIRAIEKTAALQPNVGTVVRNDIFRLNASPGVRYGVFAWLQNEHSTNAETGIITYNFTFFYVDRLTARKDNELAIQSQGIETWASSLATTPSAPSTSASPTSAPVCSATSPSRLRRTPYALGPTPSLRIREPTIWIITRMSTSSS